MAVSLLDLAPQSSQPQPVKIDLLPQQPLHLPHCAMQLVNLHSYIAVKEISEFVSLSLNVYLDYVTLCQLAPPLRCKLALLHKF
jgi:hypothetical protein